MKNEDSTITDSAENLHDENKSKRKNEIKKNKFINVNEGTVSKINNLNKKIDKVITLNNNENKKEDDNFKLCLICTEEIVWFAFGKCNHKICHICCLRLRGLYKSNSCTLCKVECNAVIFSNDCTKLFKDITLSDLPFMDKKLQIYFDNEEIYEETMILLRLNCPDPECEVYCASGWNELKRHVKAVHESMMCDLCIKHKKVFTHEHTLYAQNELSRHYRSGDPDDPSFKGHPECGFCKKSYFQNDELYEHCREKHEQCFICQRKGVRHQYFRDYKELELHFRTEHVICSERECLEKKFVVFDSDIDLKGHQIEAHGTYGKKGAVVDVNFSYHNSSASDYQRSNRGRGRGRAQNSSEDSVSSRLPLQTQLSSSKLDRNSGVPNSLEVQTSPSNFEQAPEELSSTEAFPHLSKVNPQVNLPLQAFSKRLQGNQPEDYPALSPSSSKRSSSKQLSEREKFSSANIANNKSVQSKKEEYPALPTNAIKKNKGNVNTRVIDSSSELKTASAASFNHQTSSKNLSSSSPQNPKQKVNDPVSNKLEINKNTPEDPDILLGLSCLLQNDKTRFQDFKTLAANFKNSNHSAVQFLEAFAKLIINKGENSLTDQFSREMILQIGKVWKKLAISLNDDSKHDKMLQAWNDFKVKQKCYLEDEFLSNGAKPYSLPNSSSSPQKKILVIKSNASRHRFVQKPIIPVNNKGKESHSQSIWGKNASREDGNMENKNAPDAENFPTLKYEKVAGIQETERNIFENTGSVWKGNSRESAETDTNSKTKKNKGKVLMKIGL
ncbi:hypothetical protein HK099_001242 [Clydaea vesicula]|uniref:RING-type E3 ubiquitin transferase n=1 Tax=Clydaea vesicula TaxID=447962 RepID=A0AAD5U3M8_9FUNG|nr:hypothetical protein HK099_001242 [Clydaea vesicula]